MSLLPYLNVYLISHFFYSNWCLFLADCTDVKKQEVLIVVQGVPMTWVIKLIPYKCDGFLTALDDIW